MNLLKPVKKSELIVLKAFIKGLAQESKDFRAKIKKAPVEKRNEMSVQKYGLSSKARLYLLAYAFLQGKPFNSLERNKEHLKYISYHTPWVKEVHALVQQFLPWMYSRIEISSVIAWMKEDTKIFLTAKEQYELTKDVSKTQRNC